MFLLTETGDIFLFFFLFIEIRNINLIILTIKSVLFFLISADVWDFEVIAKSTSSPLCYFLNLLAVLLMDEYIYCLNI